MTHQGHHHATELPSHSRSDTRSDRKPVDSRAQPVIIKCIDITVVIYIVTAHKLTTYDTEIYGLAVQNLQKVD